MYFGAIVALTLLGIVFQRRFRKRKSDSEGNVLDNDDTLRDSILTPLSDKRHRLGEDDDDDDDDDSECEYNERHII